MDMEEMNMDEVCEERAELEDEIEIIKETIEKLYEKLKGDLSKEEQDEILVEIANERTMIRDIECMIADLN